MSESDLVSPDTKSRGSDQGSRQDAEMPSSALPAGAVAPAAAKVDLPPARQLLQLLEATVRDVRAASAIPAEIQHTGVIRVLRMKLKPEALGEVDVTLRRSGTELRVEVNVAKQAAANAIQADIELLKERIGSLLHPESPRSVHITVQPLEGNTGAAPFDGSNAGSDHAAPNAFAQGQGGQPPSHKEEASSGFRGSLRHEEDVPMRPVASVTRVV